MLFEDLVNKVLAEFLGRFEWGSKNMEMLSWICYCIAYRALSLWAVSFLGDLGRGLLWKLGFS
jgi:hypothetical protein